MCVLVRKAIDILDIIQYFDGMAVNQEFGSAIVDERYLASSLYDLNIKSTRHVIRNSVQTIFQSRSIISNHCLI